MGDSIKVGLLLIMPREDSEEAIVVAMVVAAAEEVEIMAVEAIGILEIMRQVNGMVVITGNFQGKRDLINMTSDL